MPLQLIPTEEKRPEYFSFASLDKETAVSQKTHPYPVTAVDVAILYAEVWFARKQNYLTWIHHRYGRDEL